MSNLSVEPQSILKLLRCGLQKDSGHQLTFNNTTLQETYFTGKVLLSYTEFTYIRESNAVVVGDNIETVRSCNYMMFQNKGFNTKWFYAFIDRVEYVNENATRVYFTIDCWQTYMHDFDYHPVFVEREHTNDDTVGANIVPETIGTGEYKCYNEDYYTGLDNLVYVIQATAPAPGYLPVGVTWKSSTNYGGVCMVGGAYITNDPGWADVIMGAYLSSTDQNVKDAVYNVYVLPKNFIANSLPSTSAWEVYQGQSQQNGDNKNISKPTQIGSYVVKNKKLLTYPFCYLLISNNNGMSNVLKYEDWNTSSCTFSIKGVPAVGGSIKLVPDGYKGTGGAEDNGIMAGKFPVCNWVNDNYTNWLTQNGVNQKLEVLSQVGNMVTAGAVGTSTGANGSVGGVANGINQIWQSAVNIGKIVQNDRVHQMQAPSATGNTNGGDVNIASKKNGFFFYHMSVSEEMARVIDDYFTMYGYQTNKLKNPNVIGRQNWNYVKTIGCDFDAKNVSNMPPEAEKEIQRMFDNGVTFWHNPATMYDYTQSNNIVTP